MATLKKLMTLMSKEGVQDQRGEIISAFTHGRTSSAKHLNPQEIDTLCEFYEKNSREALDKKRKRVIRAQFAVFELMNKQVSMDYVKACICRRAKTESINQITSGKLDNIYNALLDAQKQLRISGRLVDAHFLESKSYN